MSNPVFAPQSSASAELGNLPEWDLTDLYPAVDAPEVAADLKEILDRSTTFEASYKGRLAELAEEQCPGPGHAVRAYEDLEDLMGRLISFAGLVYAENTIGPNRRNSTAMSRSRSRPPARISCSSRWS